VASDAPSLDLAGLLIILGAVLAGLCWRNIAEPPPHYEKLYWARWAMWAGLFAGLLLLLSGVWQAVLAWSMLGP